jgi:GT2 family glycosyltransferase
MMQLPEPLESGPVTSRRLPLDEGPSEDVLVWTSAGVVPCPGAVASLVATLQRFPQAGAVVGRILEFTGRLHHAGGVVGLDASLRSRGDGNWNPDDPRYAFVQAVDYGSSLFMATTRRAFDAAGGFADEMPQGALRDADFCLRLQACGYAVYYQPESVAVCSAALSRALGTPAAGLDLARRRQEFGARWKTVLQSRVPRGDVWES